MPPTPVAVFFANGRPMQNPPQQRHYFLCSNNIGSISSAGDESIFFEKQIIVHPSSGKTMKLQPSNSTRLTAVKIKPDQKNVVRGKVEKI